MKKLTCRLCKTKPLYLRQGMATSKYCVSCRKIKAEEKKEKKKTTKSWQKSEYKRLHKKAWALWSVYIRSRHLRVSGMGECYTCRLPFRWQEMHAGHFFHGKLDFDERNIHPQCTGCNTYRHGNLAIYGTRLAQKLGARGMQQLKMDAYTKTYTIEDLEEIIEKYKEVT